ENKHLRVSEVRKPTNRGPEPDWFEWIGSSTSYCGKRGGGCVHSSHHTVPFQYPPIVRLLAARGIRRSYLPRSVVLLRRGSGSRSGDMLLRFGGAALAGRLQTRIRRYCTLVEGVEGVCIVTRIFIRES